MGDSVSPQKKEVKAEADEGDLSDDDQMVSMIKITCALIMLSIIILVSKYCILSEYLGHL